MHNHNFNSSATTNYSTSPRRNSPTHSFHLKIQKISSPLFHQQAHKSSAPENIQRLFRLQNCLSRKSSVSWKYSKTFQAASSTPAATNNHPASSIPAATSNQPASSNPAATSNQQQQPAAATSNSNQQQQPAAATSSSKQQQRSTAATSNSNHHQQPAAATSIRPASSTYTVNAGIC